LRREQERYDGERKQRGRKGGEQQKKPQFFVRIFDPTVRDHCSRKRRRKLYHSIAKGKRAIGVERKKTRT